MNLDFWKIGFWAIIGFAGQGLFFARFLIQWLASEKKKESYVPKSFWFCSVLGGLLVIYYTVAIHNPVVIAGVSISFLVAIRNLLLIYHVDLRKNYWIPLLSLLILASMYPVWKSGHDLDKATTWVGIVGEVIFSTRFVIQWIVSEKQKKSVMPPIFWYFSVIGGTIRLLYALDIQSLPLIFGNAVGLVPYTRNLILIKRQKQSTAPPVSKKPEQKKSTTVDQPVKTTTPSQPVL